MMQKSTKALEPFTTNSWNWSNKNVVALEKELDKEDRQVFSFNIKEEFHWQEYLVIYVQVLFLNIQITKEYNRDEQNEVLTLQPKQLM